MSARTYRRVYVIGAYLPNGGTYMAYHVGRIVEREFGIPAIAVRIGEESSEHGIHDYDLRMPIVGIAEMEHSIGADDIMIVNPSFSSHQFGMRLPGTKICYVQGFNTFALLDLRLDHYIAASDFVAHFLRNAYSMDAPVIAPFIELEKFPDASDWNARPASTVLAYRKGLPDVWDASYTKLRGIVEQRAPLVQFAELPSTGVPHRELLARIAASRFLLTLSAAEGFGLVPLEAMAMGTLVVGYDGFGGRHYMRSGENCAVAPYPQIEKVAELLIDAIDSPQRSAEMVRRGRETAQNYSYAAFRDAWRSQLARSLGLPGAVAAH